MAEGKLAIRDVKGLTPALDPTVSQETFALFGKNYVFDSKGAKSPFGNRLLTPASLTNPAHSQGVRLRLRGGDRAFHFFAFGIQEWDEDYGGYRTIYETPDTTMQPYRWTYEYLNGYLYFAHPAVGLLVYNIETRRCDPHERVGIGTPPQIIAVSLNNGHLAVLTADSLAWSAPSNGLNFSPSLGGAGFQKLEERIPGEPIMLTSYARGLLTWTTGGVMRSEFTGDKAVFRHRTLNTEYRPMNSFCTARIDEDTVIILDERGLYQSRGEVLQPYAPIFNEFLINFLQERDFITNQAVRLEWDDLRKHLYVSYSDSYANPLYEDAFVYYPPLEKWGEFNESHYGILPVKIAGSQRADDYFGFVDSTGCVKYWQGGGAREVHPRIAQESRFDHLYVAESRRDSQYAAGDEHQIVSSSGRFRSFDATGITTPEGYYVGGAGYPQLPALEGLDSLFRVGLLRLNSNMAVDEMGEIHTLLIRSVKSGDSDVLTLDFNLIPDGTADEDFMVTSGSEDKGLEPLNYINHTVNVIGTLDGESTFMEQVPHLADYQKASRLYTCTVTGIWHIIEIGAAAIGEAFHVHTLELTGTPAGRYL